MKGLNLELLHEMMKWLNLNLRYEMIKFKSIMWKDLI